MSDNFHIDVHGEGGRVLNLALEIAFSSRKATHFIKTKVQSNSIAYKNETELDTLIFLYRDDKGCSPFPVTMTCNEIVPIASRFLQEVEYGPEPDQDGSNERGFRVFNQAWGHIAGSRCAIVAVQPCWMMYGK